MYLYKFYWFSQYSGFSTKLAVKSQFELYDTCIHEHERSQVPKFSLSKTPKNKKQNKNNTLLELNIRTA